MLTGKNKEEFEKWYNRFDKNYLDFKCLQFEMQLGVLLAYYNSRRFYINVRYCFEVDYCWEIESKKKRFCFLSGCGGYKTINKAYKEAFKESDILMNKFLKQIKYNY